MSHGPEENQIMWAQLCANRTPGKVKIPPFDKLRAGFLAQRTREKWGTRLIFEGRFL